MERCAWESYAWLSEDCRRSNAQDLNQWKRSCKNRLTPAYGSRPAVLQENEEIIQILKQNDVDEINI